MRLLYIIGLITAIISINACAPKPGTPEATLKLKKEAIEQQQKKVEKTVSSVPKWCLKLPKSNYALYRCGFGESTNMNMSRNRAILDAKRLLADSIDSIGKPKQTREEKILAWKQAQGMSIAS